MYYTFQGTASEVKDTTGSIALDYGDAFGTGSGISYTFMVDLDAEGSLTNFNGDQGVYSDYTDKYVQYDYFYTSLISGTTVSIDDEGYYEYGTHVEEYNFGKTQKDLDPEDICTAFEYTYLYGNGFSDLTYIFIQDVVYGDILTWYEGMSGFHSFSRDISKSNMTDYIRGYDLTLVSISEKNSIVPAPEPSTFILLGSALAGLVFMLRNRTN